MQQRVRNWSLEKLELLFGLYLTWQGVSILATGRAGEKTVAFHYLVGLADIVHVPPGIILALLFLIPGLLVVVSFTRRIGLLVATLCMLFHAIGVIRSVVLSDDGAVTGPNTYLFIAFLAAWLYLTERNAT